jgi:ribosomal protein L7/L12
MIDQSTRALILHALSEEIPMNEMRDDERVRNLMAELAWLRKCAVEMAEQVAAGAPSFINAIRLYRAATGAGLKDSKDHLDRFRPSMPHPEPRLDAIERRLLALENRAS